MSTAGQGWSHPALLRSSFFLHACALQALGETSIPVDVGEEEGLPSVPADAMAAALSLQMPEPRPSAAVLLEAGAALEALLLQQPLPSSAAADIFHGPFAPCLGALARPTMLALLRASSLAALPVPMLDVITACLVQHYASLPRTVFEAEVAAVCPSCAAMALQWWETRFAKIPPSLKHPTAPDIHPAQERLRSQLLSYRADCFAWATSPMPFDTGEGMLTHLEFYQPLSRQPSLAGDPAEHSLPVCLPPLTFGLDESSPAEEFWARGLDSGASPPPYHAALLASAFGMLDWVQRHFPDLAMGPAAAASVISMVKKSSPSDCRHVREYLWLRESEAGFIHFVLYFSGAWWYRAVCTPRLWGEFCAHSGTWKSRDKWAESLGRDLLMFYAPYPYGPNEGPSSLARLANYQSRSAALAGLDILRLTGTGRLTYPDALNFAAQALKACAQDAKIAELGCCALQRGSSDIKNDYFLQEAAAAMSAALAAHASSAAVALPGSGALLQIAREDCRSAGAAAPAAVAVLHAHMGNVEVVVNCCQALLCMACFDAGGACAAAGAAGALESAIAHHADSAVIVASASSALAKLHQPATASGPCVVSGSEDWAQRVWDIDSGVCVRVICGDEGKNYLVCVLEGGRVVSLSNDRGNSFRVRDAATGKFVYSWSHFGTVRSMCALQGKLLATSYAFDRRYHQDDYYALSIWNPVKEQCVARLRGHTLPVRGMCEAEGGRLLSASEDCTLRVWDTGTGACVLVLTGHTHCVNCVCTLGDGHIVSGSQDMSLRVWDAATGKCLRMLAGHSASVTAVVSLGGGRLVSASEDHTLRVWNAATGACERVLSGHTDGVRSMCTLSDGRLVSGSNNCLRVWDAATGVCTRVIEGGLQWVHSLCALNIQHPVAATAASPSSEQQQQSLEQ